MGCARRRMRGGAPTPPASACVAGSRRCATQSSGEPQIRTRVGEASVFILAGTTRGLLRLDWARKSKMAEFFGRVILILGPKEMDEFRRKFRNSGQNPNLWAREGASNDLCKVWAQEPPDCILRFVSAKIPEPFE